jgi:hypothetical protein
VSVEGDNVLVKLTSIQGGIDLLNERVQGVRGDVTAMKLEQVNLTARVTALETVNSIRRGERQGMALGGRIAWAMVGCIPGAAAALGLSKVFGL